MSDVRKLLATALQSSDLSSDPNGESALDRILAMAHADRLGSLLWRLRLANDRGSFRPAVLVLTSRMQSAKGAMSMRAKVASVAIMEWLDDVCRHCRGRGYHVIPDTPVCDHACTYCNGSGKQRHSDHARAVGLELDVETTRKWEPHFARAHALIASADRRTWIEVATQLERIIGRPGIKREVLAMGNVSHGILQSEGEKSAA